MSPKTISVAMMLLSTSVVFAQSAPPTQTEGHRKIDLSAVATTRFKDIDKNNDGKLSLDEITAFQASRSSSTAKRREGAPAGNAPRQGASQTMPMAERFKTADTDKDGSLNVEEFTAMMQRMVQNRSRNTDGMSGN